MAEESELLRQKWVRVMGEYVCDGLWQQDGCPACADDLPISAELRQRLLAWAERYNAYDVPPEPTSPPFDMEAFATEGLAIACAIKAELPDWTVIYFDEQQVDDTYRDQPRSDYEYEIKHDSVAFLRH
ncbi:hypothetical protein CSR02_06290 [Acetobacter pomorum]|uniref:Uncharacterized protein n=1 Tax=Acetobacter pomorum TaxID=65959 RepID=A0A2G4RCG5_9PROT|nr:hypothetical protein [Acetobacter pomorum]PHY94263.1 hypothetical protein CSR02_06290 [Acetobacter pomorum]